jgi:hypothetical protein
MLSVKESGGWNGRAGRFSNDLSQITAAGRVRRFTQE